MIMMMRTSGTMRKMKISYTNIYNKRVKSNTEKPFYSLLLILNNSFKNIVYSLLLLSLNYSVGQKNWEYRFFRIFISSKYSYKVSSISVDRYK